MTVDKRMMIIIIITTIIFCFIMMIITFTGVNGVVDKIEKKAIVIETSFDYSDEKLGDLAAQFKITSDGLISLDTHIAVLIELIRTEWIDIKGMEDAIKVYELKRKSGGE